MQTNRRAAYRTIHGKKPARLTHLRDGTDLLSDPEAILVAAAAQYTQTTAPHAVTADETPPWHPNHPDQQSDKTLDPCDLAPPGDNGMPTNIFSLILGASDVYTRHFMDTLADLGVRTGNLSSCSKSCIQQHYEPFTAQRLCTDGSAKRQKASARPALKRQQAKNPRGLKPSAMKTLASVCYFSSAAICPHSRPPTPPRLSRSRATRSVSGRPRVVADEPCAIWTAHVLSLARRNCAAGAAFSAPRFARTDGP